MGRIGRINSEGFIGGLGFHSYTVETRFDIHIIVRRFTTLYSYTSHLMPLCTNCAQAIPYLYTVYHSVNNVRLEQCVRLFISNIV